jgi:hypothetical protein
MGPDLKDKGFKKYSSLASRPAVENIPKRERRRRRNLKNC